ncbi:MAG: hypothetical protein LC723_11485 [Actinobacteria bacterium]|nr:hypothetical protein [Actinomycetota bacterium]
MKLLQTGGIATSQLKWGQTRWTIDEMRQTGDRFLPDWLPDLLAETLDEPSK